MDTIINKTTIGLIMCTWKRVERFKITLELLKNQIDKDFIFYVVNNNVDIKEDIEKISKLYELDIKIKIIHNDTNIGGFGRFLLAKTLVDIHEIIVFIDDDQEFTNKMISIFREKYNSNAVKSRWAFILYDRYYNRKRIISDNEDVVYCGTGGMVLPSKVFLCEELFKIPDRYLFIEDLWLSFVSNYYLNLNLKSIDKSDEFIYQIVDGKDQSTVDKLTIKDELLQFCRKSGYKK